MDFYRLIFSPFEALERLTRKALTFNTRRLRSSCAGHLAREAGTFDSLRAFLNVVLIAAAVHSDHLTGALLDDVVAWEVMRENTDQVLLEWDEISKNLEML